MNTPELTQKCGEESERYTRGHPNDHSDCLELFRRAITKNDQEAWEAIYRQYQRLVARWVDGPSEQIDERVNQVFGKFWKTITPETFKRKFTNIGAVIAYLQKIARSVRIDDHRREAKWQQMINLEDEASRVFDGDTEKSIANLSNQELLEHIEKLLNNAQERLILRCSFKEGLKPRQIAQKYSVEFTDVAEVQRTKERLVLRLSTDPRLREWWEASK